MFSGYQEAVINFVSLWQFYYTPKLFRHRLNVWWLFKKRNSKRLSWRMVCFAVQPLVCECFTELQSILSFLLMLLINRCQHWCNRPFVSLRGTAEIHRPIRRRLFHPMWTLLRYQTHTHSCFYISAPHFHNWKHLQWDRLHRRLKESYLGPCLGSDPSLFVVMDVCPHLLLCCNMCPLLRHVVPTNNQFVRSHFSWEKLTLETEGVCQECH